MTQYAVALVLTDEMEIELDRLRGEFNQHMAYISIPHITLAYPFEAKTEIERIAERLDRVAEKAKPFTLVLDGFDYFERDNNVAYIAIVNRKPVIDLHYDINRSIDGLVFDKYQGQFDREKYMPHVTIGTGIPDDICPMVKKRLGKEEVHYETDMISFSLLSDGGVGNWGAASVFRLSG